MKNKMMKCISAFLLCGILMTSSVVFAAEGQSNDPTYYSHTAFKIEDSIPSILTSWKNYVTVSEADPQGVKVQWKNGTRNMRFEIPGELSLDGMHAVFSDLEVSGNSKLAFSFSERRWYTDYVTSVEHNVLARLPFVLSLDFVTGEVTAHLGKAYSSVDSSTPSKVVHQSDNLKAASLKDKQWGLLFEKVEEEGATETKWKVTIAGESFVIAESDMKASSFSIDFSKCWMAVTAWDEGTNDISLVLNSCHSGTSACADDPENARLLQQAADTVKGINEIDEITYESGKKIIELYNTYSGMPLDMQSLVTNSGALMEAHSIYQVVKQIHEMETISLDSEEDLNDAFVAFQALSDAEKVRVSNLAELMNAKTQYIKLYVNEYAKLPEEINYIYKDRITKKVGKDVEKVVDVDGGIETITVEKDDIKTISNDGTEYLWIMYTVAGVVALAAAVTYFLLHGKDKKIRLEGESHEK